MDTNSPPVSDRTKKLRKAIESTEGLSIWGEVAVPPSLETSITSFNRALRSGGPPGGMIGVIHGPSQGGKTVLASEILRAAMASGGMALFGDAEARGVDQKWFRAICGDYINEIAYSRPKTYQSWIATVDQFREKFRKLKDDKVLPTGAFLAVAVDSLDRLRPEEEVVARKKGEKIGARGYPLRAMMNANWLSSIGPDLSSDEVLVLIVRESTKLNARPGQKTYNIRGGKAVGYDAGWVVRCTNSHRVKVGEKRIGEKHEIMVSKNSMGPHLEEKAEFYTLAGISEEHPLGLDMAREIRQEAILRGLIKRPKGKYVYGDEEIGVKERIVGWLKEPGTDGRVRLEVLAEELNDGIEQFINVSEPGEDGGEVEQ